MLARIVAVVSGLALLVCSWWITDRNAASPDGMVSLDLVAPVVTVTAAMGGSDDRVGAMFAPYGIDASTVIWERRTACTGLPAISGSLQPAGRWMLVDQPGGSSNCVLSGHWQLADLVGQTDNTLHVTQSGGRVQVAFTPPDDAETFPALDFDLRVRFPAAVESVTGAPSVSGSVVHWTGTDALWSSPTLTASSRVLPIAQEVAPWVVGTLALVLIGFGIAWPRSLTVRTASALGSPRPEAGAAGAPNDVQARPVARTPVGSAHPDPDAPWRPPTPEARQTP